LPKKPESFTISGFLNIIYFDFIPSQEYLNTIDALDQKMWPKVSIFTQGYSDTLYKSVDSFYSGNRGKLFEGKFTVKKYQ
jgi:hypothetical protein